MIDLYIAVLAGLACALEVKSTLLRDHLTLFLERHCALLRFATYRGCVYFATGFLAFDVHEKAQLLGGGMMLVVGLVNVGLGTWVAPKLKRLRRGMADEAALLSKFRLVESAQPEGLSAKEMHAFCAACGVRFNRLEMQAVFLELDAHRDGLVSQSELLTWYHGHVHPFLKKLANTKPPQPRRLLGWLRSGRHVLLELPLYASLAARLLLPFSVAGMLGAVLGSRRALVALSPDTASGDLRLKCTVYEEWVDAQDQCLTVPSGFDCCTTDRSFVQLVINFFLLLCVLLTWAVETRSEGYRRTALHVLRYASLLLHHRRLNAQSVSRW